MATFFGEVTFRSSRACDDDDDDDETVRERYETKIVYHDSQQPSPGTASCLIISDGYLANEFLHGCSSDEEISLIGEIQLSRISEFQPEDTGDFHPRKLKSSQIYLSSKGAILCQSSADAVPSVAHNLAKRILSLADQSCPVLICCSYHVSKLNQEYQGGVDDGCVTYTVKNSSKLSVSYPPLPQPSTLDSLPAAVMTQCILEDRPCVIYAAFTETYSMGNADLVMEPFLSALSLPPFADAIHINATELNKNLIRSTKYMIDRYM